MFVWPTLRVPLRIEITQSLLLIFTYSKLEGTDHYHPGIQEKCLADFNNVNIP